ncbi:MAG: 23S rRNA (pseudouridine(1915)-N(3))-methyltransferase RlmH [Gemmatimonadaceae bacterium]
MRVVIAAVGRPRDRALSDAIREYEARAARYWPLDVVEVREESARGSSADVVREREGDRLLARVGTGAYVVACDEGGTLLTSATFAGLLRAERERAARDVAFIIGGAYGLSSRVRAVAGLLLAFSRWTLPHELARLVLAEQLYRAGTIVRGEPYHK